MNTQVNTTSASFKPASSGTRLLSAALACVMSLGVAAGVVNGMSSQSDGHSLGDFVASHLSAEQPQLAAAATDRTAS